MIWRQTLLFMLLTSCAVPLDDAAEFEQTDGVSDGAEPTVLPILDGVPVRGAGRNQQWEGVVMTMRMVDASNASACTASFISDRHLITAAHCYASDGPQRIAVRAPTWDDNRWHTFNDAVVRRASGGPNFPIDIAVVDLGQPQAWATPQRRFPLFAGTPTPTDLRVYGYGGRSERNPAIDGSLRTVPGHAPVRVTDGRNGYLLSTAGAARVCVGDSGGPALREGSAAVIWGISRSFTASALRSLFRQPVCPSLGATMMFTNVSANLPFVERALGKPCTRIQLDGMAAAQCW